MRWSFPFLMIAGLWLAACGSPDSSINDMCGKNGECPMGFECDPRTRRCVTLGSVRDGGVVDAARPDALVPIDTTLVLAPPMLSGPAVTFTFTASMTGATFECSLDNGAFAACSSPHMIASLRDGAHVFAVRAVLGAMTDATPAVYMWTVSSTAPITTVTARPPPVTNLTTASVSFTVSPAGSTSECSLDGAAFAACASPQSLSGLAATAHSLEIRTTAPTGIKEANPPKVMWTVDLTPPTVQIGAPRDGATTGKVVRVSYTSGESVTRFECTVDQLPFAPCGSGTAGMNDVTLGGGEHTISVRAVDAAGNTGPAVSVDITVDDTGPVVTITPRESDCRSEAIGFSADEVGPLRCDLDGTVTSPCTSPFALPAGIGGGAHRLTVTATDGFGNAGEPESLSFSIDRTAPVVTFTGTVPAADSGGFSDPAGEIGFHADGTAVAFSCALNGGTATDCTPDPLDDQVSYPYRGLAQARNPHQLGVVATDACGNAGAPVVFTFKVDSTGPLFTLGSIGAAADSGLVTVSYTSNEPTTVRTCFLDGHACDSCGATSASCGGVSAGAHVFLVQGEDQHGNPGPAAARDDIEMSFGPNAGHLVLIGHDYLESNPQADELLVNALELVPYRRRGTFNRPLRIAAFRQNTVAAAEAGGALAAIAEIVDDAGSEEFGNPADLAAALMGKDALLVYDQQAPETIDAVGSLWAPMLEDFLARGGVVVVLDGLVNAGNTPSRTYAVLGSLLQVTGSGPFAGVGQTLARRYDDLNDGYHPGDISPLSVGESYTAPATSVIYADQDTGGPRVVYVRVHTICSLACFTIVAPVVIEKTFPVYSFTTGLGDAAGPRGVIPFQLAPATTAHSRIDCAATSLVCQQTGRAGPCTCDDRGSTTCECDGSEAAGFRLPFGTSGSYRVDLRLVDPHGDPGRSAVSTVAIDLPAVTITPSTPPAPSKGVFCYRATTVDNRALQVTLSLNSNAVSADAVKSGSCEAADTGSYSFQAACYYNIFRVDAEDRFGNASYNYVQWYQPC